MLCGPDAESGEWSVRRATGFPSIFLPPKLGNSQNRLTYCENAGVAPLPVDNLYRFELNGSSNMKNTNIKGAINYLIRTARPSILGGPEKSAFPDWWKRYTENQMRAAFEEYSKSYDEIVVKLIKGVYYPGRSFFNGRSPVNSPWSLAKQAFSSEEARRQAQGGPIFNGAMNSAFQEERVYLALINELLHLLINLKLIWLDFSKLRLPILY